LGLPANELALRVALPVCQFPDLESLFLTSGQVEKKTLLFLKKGKIIQENGLAVAGVQLARLSRRSI
jgi:hypothetical protein